MKKSLLALALMASVLLGGCAISEVTNHPKRKVVTVDNIRVVVSPFPGNEFRATRENPEMILASQSEAAEKDMLLRAIEAASGCKISSSVNYGTILVHAIVKC